MNLIPYQGNEKAKGIANGGFYFYQNAWYHKGDKGKERNRKSLGGRDAKIKGITTTYSRILFLNTVSFISLIIMSIFHVFKCLIE